MRDEEVGQPHLSLQVPEQKDDPSMRMTSEHKDDSPSIRMICDKMTFPFRGAVQKRCQAR
jgi:hypothetical protein